MTRWLAIAALALAVGCGKKADDKTPETKPATKPETKPEVAGIAEITPAALKLDAEAVGEYFVVKDVGSGHKLALWAITDDGESINAALFAGKPGAWVEKWVKKPLIEKAGMLEEVEALDLAILEIGPERHGLLHAAAIEGCGDEDCKPEDDFTTSTLFELADGGPRVVWSTDKAPGCAATDIGGCFVSTKPGADKAARDLVVKTGGKTTTYKMSGGDYKPAE